MGVSIYKGEAARDQQRSTSTLPQNVQQLFVGQVLNVSYNDPTPGLINVRILNIDKKEDNSITRTALPADKNIVKYPLPGELVLMVNGIGSNTIKDVIASQLYYVKTLTSDNSIAFNSNPNYGRINPGDDQDEIRFEGRLQNLESFKNRWPSRDIIQRSPLKPYEGDFILQGRFGSSIRLAGSAVQQGDNLWSDKSAISGDPITIATVNKLRGAESRLEDSNKDDASLYICTSQTIPVILSTSSQLKSLKYVYDVSSDGVYTLDRDLTAFQETPEEELQYYDLSTNTSLANIPDIIPDNIQDILDGIPDSSLELLVDTDSAPKDRAGNSITLAVVDGQFLQKDVAKALLAMKKAASNSGINIVCGSGYRVQFGPNIKAKSTANKTYKITSQETLRKDKSRWVSSVRSLYSSDQDFIMKAPSSGYNPQTAPPGRSNHGDGIAADLNTGSRTARGFPALNTNVYRWLIINGYKYGFIRTMSTEEWHFEFRPGKALQGPYAGFASALKQQSLRHDLKFYKDLQLDNIT